MRHKIVFIVYVFFAVVSVKAEGLGFKKAGGDSVKGYPRFKLAKPYIGWDALGLSKYLALTYQQQFIQLNKFSFLELQILLNNRNILGDIEDYLWMRDEDYLRTKAHKFAMLLLERNRICKPVSLSFGLGYLHYQLFEVYHADYKEFVKTYQRDYVILKGILSFHVSRNFLINFTVNHINASEDELYKHLPLYFYYPTNVSVGLLFGFNKKNEEKSSDAKFEKNEVFFNYTKLQLGYERFLLNRKDFNVSVSMGGTFIPFKRFGGYSYKAGWFILLDPMINFDYRLNDRLYSFVGIGGTLNDISYYVLNDKYNKYTYGLRSQIGLGYKLEDHWGIKLFYAPYITKHFDINIEYMDKFRFLRDYKLNVSLAYSFGK